MIDYHYDPETHLNLISKLEASGTNAVSPKGAIGIHQIMPDTAAEYGFDPKQLKNADYNTKVAKAITADLAKQFPGDLEAQLIAYNAGPGRARAFVRTGRDYSSLPVETQRYIDHAERLGALPTDHLDTAVNTAPAQQGVAKGPPGGEPPKLPEELRPLRRVRGRRR